MQLSQIWKEALSRPDVLISWAANALRAVLVLIAAWVFSRLARRLLGRLRNYAIRMMDKRGAGSTLEMEKRANTIVSVVSKLISLLIWLVAIVMALTELNFHIEPLLAGLGVAGLALGLGAQSLIKDWLGGLFLLLEDQLRIGDSVVINGISGGVEEINLRTTLLRGENGAVHVIANGAITTLSNLTREYSYYVFEATLAHRSDTDRALAIVESVAKELEHEEPYRQMILAPIEMMGLDKFADRGVVLKARIKTLPSKQAIVGREWNRRVKQRMDGDGIAFPQPPPQT